MVVWKGWILVFAKDVAAPLSSPRPHNKLQSMVDQSIRNTVACIMEMSTLGAAHGMAGIITQVVVSCRAVSDPILREIKGIVEQLLDSGNWLARRGGSSGDQLVQFCHGAPGITSLMSIEPSFPDLSARRYSVRLHTWSGSG